MGNVVRLPNERPPLVVRERGREWYKHPDNGKLYPSTTSILKVLAKDALVQSAANETVKAMFARRGLLQHLPEERDALRLFKFAYKDSWQHRASIGSAVHTYIEALWADAPLPQIEPEHEPYMDGFLQFVEDFHPTWIAYEITVFHDEPDYAGTFDFLALIDDYLCLFDTKTGKGVYGETALQLAAYRYAHEQWARNTGDLEPMPTVDATLVLWLKPGGYTVKGMLADRVAHRAFCGLTEALPWVKEREESSVGVAYNRARLIRALKAEQPAGSVQGVLDT